MFCNKNILWKHPNLPLRSLKYLLLGLCKKKQVLYKSSSFTPSSSFLFSQLSFFNIMSKCKYDIRCKSSSHVLTRTTATRCFTSQLCYWCLNLFLKHLILCSVEEIEHLFDVIHCLKVCLVPSGQTHSLFVLSVDVEVGKDSCYLTCLKECCQVFAKSCFYLPCSFSFAVWVKFWGYKQQPEPVTPSHIFLCMGSLSLFVLNMCICSWAVFSFFCLKSSLFRAMFLCVSYSNTSSN